MIPHNALHTFTHKKIKLITKKPIFQPHHKEYAVVTSSRHYKMRGCYSDGYASLIVCLLSVVHWTRIRAVHGKLRMD